MDQERETRLRTLFDEHATALLGYVTRLTGGDRGRAEDIVQETLLRAWQHEPDLVADHTSLRPWLFTVARNLAIDAHRARGSRPHEVGDAALDVVPADSDLENSLDRIVVADALGALSSDHRAVILETFYRGHTVAEAAEVLGVPEGTVKSRSFYALRALRLALTERGVRA